jgi:hypothetical protein
MSDDEPPDGIDPLGVPGRESGRDLFVLLLGVTVAALGLAVTLCWIVYQQVMG